MSTFMQSSIIKKLWVFLCYNAYIFIYKTSCCVHLLLVKGVYDSTTINHY